MTTSKTTPLLPIGVLRTDANDIVVLKDTYLIPAWQGTETIQWFDEYCLKTGLYKGRVENA